MSPFQTLLSVAFLTSATLTQAATVFIDFGDSAQPTTAGSYNNLTKGGTSLLAISNMKDSTGANSGMSINVTGFHGGNNPAGTTAPTGSATMFDAQATRDNFFGSTALFSGVTAPTGTIVIGGLDPSGNTSYTFDFFASRTSSSDNREAEYAVTGTTTGSVFLDAANNTSNIVTTGAFIPTPAGNITITVDPGPNNNNASGFFYIGAARITTAVVPEPSVTLTAGLAGLMIAGLRRRRA